MTGIEMIAKERQEQIEKHGRTLRADKAYNSQEVGGYFPLQCGTIYLLDQHFAHTPTHWDGKLLDKMKSKPYKERLIIAGALIAAEIDRLSDDKSV